MSGLLMWHERISNYIHVTATCLHLDGRRPPDVLRLQVADDGLWHSHVLELQHWWRQVVPLADDVELVPHLSMIFTCDSEQQIEGTCLEVPLSSTALTDEAASQHQ